MNAKAQIVATIGPSSEDFETLRAMVLNQLGVVRINFSWGDFDARTRQINFVRELEKEYKRKIPIIVDLPGPRVQKEKSHTYDTQAISSITEHDIKFIEFAVGHEVDYIAVSFVGSAQDIHKCREIITSFSGGQKVIAKIERKIALESLEQIIHAADAVMIARGDLGNEVPIEQIPFIEEDIIHKAKASGKPVITATQMMFSMVEEPTPTRAEVTDVAIAIIEGSDAVMLSEETSIGKNPIEAVAIMERIILEAEKHLGGQEIINPL